ncbi:MAG: Capsular polysaccharide biosynthesis protein [Flavobacteriaceae bacterium FS1-H7996/R]|nr:MAG: Capsular polysaccharide biosynthesis protein [Flavobacteriaceae bacterium FS1-H7996/R]
MIVTGWSPILKESPIIPQYIKLPEPLNYFAPVYCNQIIKSEFENYDLSIEFLLNRFNWWFPKSKNDSEVQARMAFLHYHLCFFLTLIKKYTPFLVLVWNGNDPRQYILSHLCQWFKINRLFVERGTLPSLLFYDSKGVLSHSSIASLQQETFIKNTCDLDKFKHYVGWYKNTSETLWEQPERKDQEDLRTKFGIDKEQRIILFIGQVDNDIQAKLFSPYFSSNKQAFEWFIDYGVEEGYFVLGKHHPKSSVPKYEYDALIQNKLNVVWTDQVPLEQCLEIADKVVTVNSSVIFDALLYEKPVLSLGATMLDGKGILYEYNPKNMDLVLKLFYKDDDLSLKINNFKCLLDYMLNYNFVFLNEDKDILRFTQLLLKLQDNDILKKTVDDLNANVVENYLNNIGSLPKSKPKLKNKVVSYLKKIVKKIKYSF